MTNMYLIIERLGITAALALTVAGAIAANYYLMRTQGAAT